MDRTSFAAPISNEPLPPPTSASHSTILLSSRSIWLNMASTGVGGEMDETFGAWEEGESAKDRLAFSGIALFITLDDQSGKFVIRQP